MSNSRTSQFMDKQIMDLSNSHSTATANNSSSNTDFIDLMNRPSEKKNEMIPSYDFMPIRPAGGSSSPPPPATRSSIFDSGDEEPPRRTWNSLDSKTNASTLRNYSSLDADEPAKLTLGNNHKPVNATLDVSLISEIDRIIKKHADNLMHAMDGVSSRVTQLETRTRNLEHLVDDLKVSVENIHGDNDGKRRQLENILREVQTGVQFIIDKQEIAETQFPKVEQVGIQNTPQTEHTQPGAYSPPNAPHPPPQQNYQLPPPQQNYQLPPPQQYSQNQVPPVPQQESYFPRHSQNPENPSQLYQLPPPQQPHHSLPLPNQYPPPHQTPYSQPLPSSQPHLPFSTVNSSLQPPSSHRSEEMPYVPSKMSYSPSSRVPPHPSQQFYGPPPNIYEPPSIRPGLGNSGPFGPSSGNVDPTYPYSGSDSPSPMRHQVSSLAMGQGGESGFGQLPTARILPQAVPTASGVGSGSGSGSWSGTGGSSNKVPIDDVVDKVTNMGFSRDLVRSTVRKLTENGQAVDLNVVLDKLMNDGHGQGPRAWYDR